MKGQKEKSKNVDSRQKLSGMTKKGMSPLNVSIILLSLIPEWFYEESKNGRRHLYGSKKKKHGCLIKDFRHDERGVIPEWFYQQSGTIRAKSTYRLLFFVAAMTLLICHPGSTRNLNYLRAKAFGFPIEDFGNDGGGGIPDKIFRK